MENKENTNVKKCVLVADSGGTNIRFRLLDLQNEKFVANSEFCCKHEDFDAFEDEAQAYARFLEEHNLSNCQIVSAYMDVAGPLNTKTGVFHTTNTPKKNPRPGEEQHWTWDIKGVEQALTKVGLLESAERSDDFDLVTGQGVKSKDGTIHLYNDLEAHTAGLEIGKTVNIVSLCDKEITNDNDILYIVPGTGLGVGVKESGVSKTTEGGSFSLPSERCFKDLFRHVPDRDEEGDLFYASPGRVEKYVEQINKIFDSYEEKQGRSPLYAEDVISGRALWVLYNGALTTCEEGQQRPEEIIDTKDKPGSVEFMKRLGEEDKFAERVMNLCVLPVLVSVIQNAQAAYPLMNKPVVLIGGFFDKPVYQRYFQSRQEWLNNAIKHNYMQAEPLKNFGLGIAKAEEEVNGALEGLKRLALADIKTECGQSSVPPEPVFVLKNKEVPSNTSSDVQEEIDSSNKDNSLKSSEGQGGSSPTSKTTHRALFNGYHPRKKRSR